MKKLFAFLIALTLAVTCASSVFAEDKVLLGDYYLDGKVDSLDFGHLYEHYMGYPYFPFEPHHFSLTNADMNGDGEVNFKDLACMIRQLGDTLIFRPDIEIKYLDEE